MKLVLFLVLLCFVNINASLKRLGSFCKSIAARKNKIFTFPNTTPSESPPEAQNLSPIPSNFNNITTSSQDLDTQIESYELSFYQTMIAGAVARGLAQTLIHPLHAYKTKLQVPSPEPLTWHNVLNLFRGMDAQLLFSLPHGAIQFMVMEQVKPFIRSIIPLSLLFLSDFLSSAVSTVLCSVISTPQMVLTDRLMAGLYPSFPSAIWAIWKEQGMMGFYCGWWPALVQKIPSYGLTWMFYQQLQRLYRYLEQQKGLPSESHAMNFLLGAVASILSVSIMTPLDTIKTRLVLQTRSSSSSSSSSVQYTGIVDCARQILQQEDEGIAALYRSLLPRILSVLPMMAIQFGVFEYVKSYFLTCNQNQRTTRRKRLGEAKKQVTAI